MFYLNVGALYFILSAHKKLRTKLHLFSVLIHYHHLGTVFEASLYETQFRFSFLRDHMLSWYNPHATFACFCPCPMR